MLQGHNATFHRGGYFRFSVDVSQYVKRGETNELVVFVYDPTDSEGDIPRRSFVLIHFLETKLTGQWASRPTTHRISSTRHVLVFGRLSGLNPSPGRISSHSTLPQICTDRVGGGLDEDWTRHANG
jgi:hypothetical protein